MRKLGVPINITRNWGSLKSDLNPTPGFLLLQQTAALGTPNNQLVPLDSPTLGNTQGHVCLMDLRKEVAQTPAQHVAQLKEQPRPGSRPGTLLGGPPRAAGLSCPSRPLPLAHS